MAPVQSGDELRQQLHLLEAECSRIVEQLARLETHECLPGLHLLIEVGGYCALLPAAPVREIARLVEWTPVPGMPAFVLGSFIYRGQAVFAVNLAACLGRPQEPALDAHLVVLASSVPMALVVDRVGGLVDSPLLAAQELRGAEEAPLNAALVSAVCRVGQQLFPLLSVERLVSWLHREQP
jgi:purine-binding chemotaxis protein CheW